MKIFWVIGIQKYRVIKQFLVRAEDNLDADQKVREYANKERAMGEPVLPKEYSLIVEPLEWEDDVLPI